MEEEIQLQLEDTEERMQKTIDHLKDELKTIRAGKATPDLLDGIMVDYYGNMTPLNQVSNVNTPDAKTISVQPWEKSMIDPIEKAILVSNIGLTPINNGELIRINIPILTEERRKELVKQVKSEGENSKVGVRSVRRDAMEAFKKMKKDGLSEDQEKDAEAKVQELTDAFSKQIDVVVAEKEKDIMTI